MKKVKVEQGEERSLQPSQILSRDSHSTPHEIFWAHCGQLYDELADKLRHGHGECSQTEQVLHQPSQRMIDIHWAIACVERERDRTPKGKVVHIQTVAEPYE